MIKYVDRWGHRLYRYVFDSSCFELRVAKNAKKMEEWDYEGTTYHSTCVNIIWIYMMITHWSGNNTCSIA